VTNAQDLIGEIGVDMTVFPTAGHLCSWARVAPRPKESGGRRKGGSATGKGNPYIGATLGEAAVTVGRTQTFLGAKLRRLVRHMPKKKAQGAVMRTQLCIAHALLSDPEAAYRELGPGYYDQRAGTRHQARGHIRSLERLGYKVTIEPLTPRPTPKPASSSPGPPANRTHRPAGAPRREASGTNRRRLLPPAQPRSYFRTRMRHGPARKGQARRVFADPWAAHRAPRMSSIGLRTIMWSGQSSWITTITSSSYPRSAVRNPARILLSKRHRHP
jgi:hypothetical protein